MANDRSAEACQVWNVDNLHVARHVKQVRHLEHEGGIVGPWSYLARLGRGTIRMTSVEYRILRLLASRPYHPFTRRRIADAVSTESHPVTVDTLSRYIHSLRAQLGFYGDYIQTVPYIGYRFKA